ncbi:S-layer homology domain-containing protein [Halalkalibacter urbisdiaboli]|uniref:S-layer homology domain-containing protein n=1 Tax=Halalkalibacter urbisdiaboli TaxID=1960589 RepID=UPI000B44C3C7|nr:S-layer homology domain-containing protein [Halalkalibacter urbisdiaboli]
MRADGKTKEMKSVNHDRVKETIDSQDSIDRVTVKIEKEAGEVSEVKIPASISKLLAEKNPHAMIEIESKEGAYRLPASEVNRVALATELGEDVTLTIMVNEGEGPNVTVQSTKEKVRSMYVEFKLFASGNGKEVEITQLHDYAEGDIHVSGEINPLRATVLKLNESDKTSVPTIFNEDVATFKTMSNGTFVIVESEVSFNDLSETYWAKDYLEKLAAKHIFKGNPDGSVKPKDSITRAELAVLIKRSLALQSGDAYTGTFIDVKGQEWYVNELMPVIKREVVRGLGNGKFAPNDKVTRQEAVVMISRAMDIVGFDAAQLDISKTTAMFTDEEAIASWAKEDVERLIQANIMEGRNDGRFDPKAPTTRAEMAKMVDELLQFVKLTNK